MFRRVPLSIIRNSFTVHSAMVYVTLKFHKWLRIKVFFSENFVMPYCRVCFIQFLFGVSILICFLCLFDIDEFHVHVTVHRNKFLYNKTN